MINYTKTILVLILTLIVFNCFSQIETDSTKSLKQGFTKPTYEFKDNQRSIDFYNFIKNAHTKDTIVNIFNKTRLYYSDSLCYSNEGRKKSISIKVIVNDVNKTISSIKNRNESCNDIFFNTVANEITEYFYKQSSFLFTKDIHSFNISIFYNKENSPEVTFYIIL